MQLTVWTYEGPPHVGAMRIATAMEGVHYVLHAPQGDTYADLLFTMIERRDKRPPVTFTTFQARDLGSDTAALFQTAVREAVDRFSPQALLVGASCTAELIQDDPAGLAAALRLPIPVIALELPSYQRKRVGARRRRSTSWCVRWPRCLLPRRRPGPRSGTMETKHCPRLPPTSRLGPGLRRGRKKEERAPAPTSSARPRSVSVTAMTWSRSRACWKRSG